MESTENLLETRLALRPAEAAQAIGVSRAELYRLMDSGEIRSKKHGSKRLILVEELRHWLSLLTEL